MKNKILTFFLFIIMILLMVGLIIIGLSIYSDFSGTKLNDIVYKLNTIAIEEPENTNRVQPSGNIDSLNIESTQPNINDETTTNRTKIDSNTNFNGFFYSQLTDAQKTFYERTSKQ